ncbi:MAG TPA: cysteine desulfurase CsdA [Gammaproteobacteria bacterium]|jgi:cysteine desulfurase/selenocysteine lyase|nr:SufS family cysteine desulfurase [Litorivicinus sp.]MDF1783061.1 SufS family cysteine desulfurase [Litorivicinaceae bacterium]HAY54865.1 cysteine desulfurase CsdA [Gammaproteobacteria bacterium]
MFDLARVRSDFPILAREVHGQPLVYFDNAATSQKPTRVIESISDYYDRYNSNVHRGVHTLSGEATDAYEGARARIGRWFGVEDPGEIILLRGATEALNLVANTLVDSLRPGDVILVGETEHHANIVPWQQLEARIGVRVIPIPVDPSGALSLESAKTLCSEHPVAVIAVGHVSNAIGALNDVQGFVTLAQENDAYSVIDGAQAAPHMMVNVKELNADFYAVSAHKCCGPTGIGVLLGRRDLLERLPPWQGGGDMIDRVSFSGTTYNELPWKFEAGTPNIADTIGFATALDYLESIDFKGAVEHEHRVHSHLTEAMLSRDKVDVLGHPDHWVSVCSFNVKGAHPTDVGTLLDQLGIAVRTGHHCAMPTMEHFGLPGTARASVAFYNSIEEVDRFLDALDRVIGMLTD